MQGFLKRGVLPEEALKMLAVTSRLIPSRSPPVITLSLQAIARSARAGRGSHGTLGTILAAMLATILLTLTPAPHGDCLWVTGCPLA